MDAASQKSRRGLPVLQFCGLWRLEAIAIRQGPARLPTHPLGAAADLLLVASGLIWIYRDIGLLASKALRVSLTICRRLTLCRNAIQGLHIFPITIAKRLLSGTAIRLRTVDPDYLINIF